MKIADPSQTTLVNEVKLMLEALPFDGARVLELGCGRAEKTRTLAETGRPREIVALEVDAIQHAKNLQIADLPIVRFAQGGAEAIPAADASFDIVIMFKSLHHVPVAHMDAALDEIARVLRPGGVVVLTVPNLAYIKHTVGLLFGYLPRTGTPTRDMAYWRQHGWDGGHLHYFTRSSLAALLQETGFKPEDWTGDGRWARARRWGTNLVGNLTVRARRRSDR